MATTILPATRLPESLDALRTRHEALRAELRDAAPDERDSASYHDVLSELHTLERRISAAANEPMPYYVTIPLTPAQYAMVDEVARHDRHADVAAFVAHEVMEAVFCFRCDLLDEDLASVERAWGGKEAA